MGGICDMIKEMVIQLIKMIQEKSPNSRSTQNKPNDQNQAKVYRFIQRENQKKRKKKVMKVQQPK